MSLRPSTAFAFVTGGSHQSYWLYNKCTVLARVMVLVCGNSRGLSTVLLTWSHLMQGSADLETEPTNPNFKPVAQPNCSPLNVPALLEPTGNTKCAEPFRDIKAAISMSPASLDTDQ